MSTLSIRLSAQSVAQGHCSCAYSGNAAVDGRVEQVSRLLLRCKVAHERPRSDVLLGASSHVGGHVCHRIVDGSSGAVLAPHNLRKGHMPLCPGHFDRARTLRPAGIRKGLPKVPIAAQLNGLAKAMTAKQLVRHPGSVGTVSGHVHCMGGSDA